MTHNQWTLTSYNSFETETVLAAQPWHVWINPRQGYCDRGHWDWGNSGSGPAGLSPEPSYYFMSLDTALLELEECSVPKRTRTIICETPPKEV